MPFGKSKKKKEQERREASRQAFLVEQAKKKKKRVRSQMAAIVAVTRLQSIFRARKARELAADKKEQTVAAKKIQAIHRGKKTRDEVEKMKFDKEMGELANDPEAVTATTRIQAIQRGRRKRKEVEEQTEAARKIQKIQRGKLARKERAEQTDAALKIQKVHRGKLARQERQEQAAAASKIQAIHRGKKTRERLGNGDYGAQPSAVRMVRPGEESRNQKVDKEENEGSESFASTLVMPTNLPQAMRIIRELQSREKDLLGIQKIQNTKMKTLKHKAETTVGQLAQEIDMLSTEMQEMRFALEQESKKTKQEGNLRRAAEQEAARLRREISSLKVELKDGTSQVTRMTVENQRLEAILSKVGDGALDDLEDRLRKSEELRWKAEMDCEKLRAELNWQTNSRMDERLTVASLEDELQQSRAEKRRSEMRKIQVEEALEQCLAQLRSKKRETSDMRKRIEMMISSNRNRPLGESTGRGMPSFDSVVKHSSSPTKVFPPAKGSGKQRFAAYIQDGTMIESPKKAQTRKAAELRKSIHTLRRNVGKGIDSYVDAYSTTKFPKQQLSPERNQRGRTQTGRGDHWR